MLQNSVAVTYILCLNGAFLVFTEKLSEEAGLATLPSVGAIP